MKPVRSLAALLLSAAIALPAAAEPAQRVVVAGGDLTEIVYALGAQDRVVGVDTTSLHPPEALETKAQVGYARRLSAEGLLSVAPDLILATFGAGPAPALDQVEAAGVPVRRGPEANAPELVPQKIRFVGAALEMEAEAEALATRYEAELAAVAAKVAKLKRRPKALLLISVARGAAMAAGEGSNADAVIRAAGAVNAAQGFEGYKPMSQEAIIAAAPEVILLVEPHVSRIGGAEAVLARPDIAATPAGAARRTVTMNALLLLGFGPRTPAAIAELARALHPDEAAEAGL